MGFVANRMSDTISIVDLDGMMLIDERPIGRDPVDVDGPRHVVLDRMRGVGYVALSYPLSVGSPHVGDVRPSRPGYAIAFALSDLRPLGEIRLDPSSAELALSDDGTELAVTHYDEKRSLQATELTLRRATLALIAPAIGIADGSALARKITVCVVPGPVVYGNAGLLFVACTGEDSVIAVDSSTGRVVGSTPTGDVLANQPYALVRDPSHTRMVLSNRVARTVVVFSMEEVPAQQLLVQLREGVPYFAAWVSASEFLVALQGPSSLARVDVASGTVAQLVAYSDAECLNPSEPYISQEGRVFMVCEDSHYRRGAIVELDETTLEVVSRVELGVYPDRLSVLEP